MDSNVSKNTNSHNFFKLGVKREKIGISVRNLLKLELLSILNLYQQKFKVKIEQKLIASIIENKISISNHKKQSDESIFNLVYFANTKFVPLAYSCPVGLLLAANLSDSMQKTMQQLRQIVSLKTEANLELADSNRCSLLIEIVDRGWINFYLSSKFMSSWLQQSLVWHRRKINLEASLQQVSVELFSAQYFHARCYSLLSLGVREKLITIAPNTAWIKPLAVETILWSDERGELYLSETAEYNLIWQLSHVADVWNEDEDTTKNVEQSLKLAKNVSQSTAIFLANCRFLGEVKAKQPETAIARLGLIALVQLWLQKILQEKLAIAAPRSM